MPTATANAIRHRVGIRAAPEEVRDSFATLPGLARFWTETVEGDAAPGGTLRFWFGRPEPSCVVKVETVEPDQVRWRCTDGPAEWVGTTLTFEIEDAPDETVVVFTHAGWPEPGAFQHHCSTKWAYFLLGLKATLEGAPAAAAPHDAPISSWG